jgi:hypothetical protein
VHNERRREHGSKVREESAGQSREGDARTETRHAEKRRLGQEGKEPQTSDRHRTLRSATRRREGAAGEEGVVEEVVGKEIVFEEVVVKEVFVEKIFIEEVGQEVIEEIFEEAVRIAILPSPAQTRVSVPH